MREKIISFLAAKIAVIIIKWQGNLLHYKKAIRRAESLAKGSKEKKGKRTYIYFIGGKYRCLNRKQIQYWRNKTKGVRTDLSVSRMSGIQLYDTLGHINSHPTYTHIEMRGTDIVYKHVTNL